MTRDVEFKAIIQQQRQFFATGATLPVEFRIDQLKKLKSLLQIHETEIATALKKDLNKASLEAIFNEILLVTAEIDFVIKHLKNWTRIEKVPTPPLLWPGKSIIQCEPYGSVLIIGPWNYPFLLIMSPLVGAISAGNCAIVKPSEIATHTQNIILQLLNDHFSADYICAIQASPEHIAQLLQEKLDYIFFTGDTQIGKVVMTAAAKHLTPVTLELGGKSPCIVDETADLNFAARRIAWAKTTNAGQVCIAPDFLYLHRSHKDAFVTQFQAAITEFFGKDPAQSPHYGRIINKKHFIRLCKLMEKGNILLGGQINPEDLYISPTLIEEINWDHPIMQEEIFGPLLPILIYDDFAEVITTLQSRPKSLALYLFTNNKAHEKQMLSHVSFGGGCINDCIVQLANVNLPFGGIGHSGMGRYRGKYSFETFSHRKSIYKKILPLDFKLAYPPYSNKKLWWLRRLFRL